MADDRTEELLEPTIDEGIMFLSDEEIMNHPDMYGEVSDSNIFDRMGQPTTRGLMSDLIFGKGCACGRIKEEGCMCPVCGREAIPDAERRKMGYIRLPIGWPIGTMDLVAAAFGVKAYDLEKCLTGEKPLPVNGSAEGGTISGPAEVEDMLSRKTHDEIIAELHRQAESLKEQLKLQSFNTTEQYERTENSIERLETMMTTFYSMKLNGMPVSSLIRHTLPVMPKAFRRISEVGNNPMGKMNVIYTEVLHAKDRYTAVTENLDRIPENVRDAVYPVMSREVKKAELDFADAMMKCKDLDVLDGKKGMGRAYQTIYVPLSFRAVAEASTNLYPDEIAIPYRQALNMYEREVTDLMLNSVRNNGNVARVEFERGEISQEEFDEIRKALKAEETRIRLSIKNDLSEVKGFMDRDPAVEEALQRVLEDELVLVKRDPVVSENSIRALKPVIGAANMAVSVNPATAPFLNLDHDGDQLAIYKIMTEEARKEARELFSAFYRPFSSVTAEPLGLNDREYAWGTWLATDINMPEESHFKRKTIITDVNLGVGKDGKALENGTVYARHVYWTAPEGFKPKTDKTVFGERDVVGFDSDGKPMKTPWPCILRNIGTEEKEQWALLSIPRDRIHVPFGAKVNVKAGDIVKEGEKISEWKMNHFETVEDADAAFEKGEISYDTAFILDPIEEPLSYGRIMVSRLLSKDPTEIEISNRQMSKKDINREMTALWESLSEDETITPEKRADIFKERVMELQNLGLAYASAYGSYNDYDILMFEKDNLTHQVDFSSTKFRYSSIQSQIKSGAKGSISSAKLFLKYLFGLDPFMDSKTIIEEVAALDKSGGGTVTISGALQRMFGILMPDLKIEKEDCGSETVKTVSPKEGKSRIEWELRGRTLGEDYTDSEGNTYPKGSLIGPSGAAFLAEDIVTSSRSIKIRTLAGCKCAGGCAACFGADPTDWSPVKVGSRMGSLAGNALTSLMTEQMVLKFTTKTDNNQDLSLVDKTSQVLTGTPGTWKTAYTKGPEAARDIIISRLEEMYIETTNTGIYRQWLEMAANAMISVDVKERTEKDGKTSFDEKHVSLSSWISEYKGKKNIISTPRIRSIRAIAGSIWGNDVPDSLEEYMEQVDKIIKKGGAGMSSALEQLAIQTKSPGRTGRGQGD